MLDNFETGLKKNLAPFAERIDLRDADLTDVDAVRSACEGMDYVLHQGALPSVPRSVKQPRPSHETNIGGTFNVLEGARLAGVKRVVYARVFFGLRQSAWLPSCGDHGPQPLSPYAVQKLTGELYMQAYWRVYGLETVCLRYFNIFGARQVPDSPYSGVMARFALMMMRGERPTIFGDGEQGRDFTHIDNVVSANLLALEAPSNLAAGRVFNIACGERHTLNESLCSSSNLRWASSIHLYTDRNAREMFAIRWRISRLPRLLWDMSRRLVLKKACVAPSHGIVTNLLVRKIERVTPRNIAVSARTGRVVGGSRSAHGAESESSGWVMLAFH